MRTVQLGLLIMLALSGFSACQKHQSVAPIDQASSVPRGSTWASIATLPDFYTGLWDPILGGKGVLPPAPAPAPASNASKSKLKAGSLGDANQRGCLPKSAPDNYGSPFPIQFLFAPNEVILIFEFEHDVRHIYLNEQQPEFPEPAYMGNSVGHWDGDTLIIDTRAIKTVDDSEAKSTPHVTERIHLKSADALSVEITRQWADHSSSAIREYRRQKDWRLRDYTCNENPRDTIDANGNPDVNLGP